jgi:hypothetical protein
LRASLNPFSRFDFGLLPGLPQPGDWQANAAVKRFEYPDCRRYVPLLLRFDYGIAYMSFLSYYGR